MFNWVILSSRMNDIDHAATSHKVLATRDYLARPELFRGSRPNIINLARSYRYQSRGYYASLLAGARGQRVIPSVETIIDLSARKLYENAIPELEDTLNKVCAKAGERPTRLNIFFGYTADQRLERFARLVFDWFRAPFVEVTIKDNGAWLSIPKVALGSVTKLSDKERAFFFECLNRYTGRQWRDAKAKTPAKYTFATLVDANEALPPSSISSLKRGSPRAWAWKWSRSASATCRGLPTTMRSSSAKRRRSPTTPIASRAVPSRKACR
jgi:hypothetical protein